MIYKCQSCDDWEELNDMQLCSDCDEKLQRDLIRKKSWDYAVATAFASEKERAKIRAEVIKHYGSKLELIA